MATSATGNVEKIISVKFDSQQAVRGIMSLNQQLEQNNADLKQMADAGKKGTKAYADLEQETKALKSQKRDLSQMVQNEIKQQTTLDGSLRNLRAQLSNLTKQYDALSKAERENVNVGGKLKNQINQVTTEIKAAEEGTQRYYRNVGNYQNAILGAIGINGRFGQSITNIINMEGGVKGAMASMEASAKAFGRTLMGLMTNPVFLAIAGIAGAGVAAKWFYDYNMGIEKALRLTREFTGLAGSDLANLRAEIAATAETYGKDYKEVLDTVNAIMSHYGKSGKEAIDVINAGFQAGADLNGNMLDKINQLSPAFKNAGVDVEQLVALISQTRSGIFSDKGLDAIVMGTSRIRQFSDSMKKALQDIGINAEEMGKKLRDGELSPFAALTEISSKLKELSPNTQEYGKVMNEVFGRAGKTISTDMVQGLADMNTSLEDLKKTTGEYGELTDELREKEKELQSAMADVFGTGESGFESLTLQAKIYVKEGLISIVKAMSSWVSWIKKTWNENDILRAALTGVITTLHLLAKVAWTPFALLVNGVKTAINVLNVLSNALKVIWQNIQTTFNGLADIFQGIKDFSPTEVLKGIEKTAKGAWGTVKAFGEGVGNAFATGFNSAATNFGNLFAGFGEIASQIDDIYNFKFPTSSSSQFVSATEGAVKAMNTLHNRAQNNNDTDTTNDNSGGASNKKGTAKKAAAKKAAATGKSDEEKAEEERQKALQALIKKGTEFELKAREEEMRRTEEGIIKLYKEREDAIKQEYAAMSTKSTEEAEALMKAKESVLNANVEQMSKDLQAFRDKQAKKQADATKKAQQDAEALVQAMISGLPEGSYMQKEWQLEQLRLQMDAELAMYEKNEQMKMAIQSKYGLQMQQIEQQFMQNQLEIQRQKYDAIAGVVGGLGEMFGEFGDESREMAILQKTLALGEIMIAQAVAIANAVKAGSNAITPWQMIAQIATSVVAVTTAMAQAFKALDSAKFATGGYIKGAGTSTSDSIPVRVSNGESIMNANTTAMFSGLLSSLNQLGGGVPIQVAQTAQNVRGEDMLARAFARGVAMLPNPVVSVVDINNGQRQVEVMNERATL